MLLVEEKNNKKTTTRKNKRPITHSKFFPLIVSFGSFIVIFSILMLIFYKKDDTISYDNKKIDQSRELVYTNIDKTVGNFVKQVPYININSNNIMQINEEIDKFVSDYLEKEECVIYYEFDNNEDLILSVMIRIIDYEDDNAPKNYFKTVNINLNTLDIMEDAELLSFFKISEDYVQDKIETKFADFYWDLVTDNKIDSAKCNLDCFISKRGFLGYMVDLNYYVKNKHLIVYKPFLIATSNNEYNYFKDTDFLFEIK